VRQPRRVVVPAVVVPAGVAPAGVAPAGVAPAGVSPADWRSWSWQMRHRIRSASELARWIHPVSDEVEAIEALAQRFHFVITPYYASLMDPDVIRVYPDRIAFCVNNECALYCRFCLRKRMVGDEEWSMQKRELQAGLDWIAATPEIRDVLLTGGDPLVFSDARLEWILEGLRAIPHVQLIRLGTRLPVTLPYRVTDALCRMLERHHPIWLNTHFNHPRELTEDAAEACDRLLRAGIPVGNQSVLLAGINDNPQIMKELNEGLVRMRVRPYYCYQAQLLEGTGHFRVPIEEGLELFRSLRGRTSGFAIPQYVLDTPHGKVPLQHPYARGREGDDYVVEAWNGKLWKEPNPR